MEPERIQRFESMLAAIRARYNNAVARMEKLKAEGKTKTATYQQMLAEKLRCGEMLDIYHIYALLDEEDEEDEE